MSMDSPMANRIRPGAVDTSSSLLAAGSCSPEEELTYSHNLLAAAPLCGEVAVLGRWYDTLSAAERTAVACFFAERCPQTQVAAVEQALRVPRMGSSDTASIGHRHDFFDHFQRTTGECRNTNIASSSGAPGELSQPSSTGPGGHAGRAGASAGAGTGAAGRPHAKSPFSAIQPFISTVNQVSQVNSMGSSDMYAHAFSSSFPASASAAAAAAATAAAAAAANGPQARQFTPWSLRQELGRPQSAVTPAGNDSASAGAVGANANSGSGLNVGSPQPPFGSYQLQAPSTWSAPGNSGAMNLPLSDSRPWAPSMRRHTHGDTSASPFRNLPRNGASAAALGQSAPASSNASGVEASTTTNPGSAGPGTNSSEFLLATAPPVSGSAPGAGRNSAMPNTLTGQSSGLGAVSKLVGPNSRGVVHEQSASPPPHWNTPGSVGNANKSAKPVAKPAKAAKSLQGSSGAVIGSGATNAAGDSGGRRAGAAAASAPATTKPALDATNPDLHKDVGSWLRSLRLHKYTENLAGLSWQEVVQLSETELETRGVCAVGARRKMLKMFEQVREEHPEDV